MLPSSLFVSAMLHKELFEIFNLKKRENDITQQERETVRLIFCPKICEGGRGMGGYEAMNDILAESAV